MKKIKRKLSQNEKRIMLLTRMLNIADLYLKERGLVEDFKAWSLEKQKGGDDTNGLQGNGKEGREDADERKDGSGCCGEGSCCKEGEEEVKDKPDSYRCYGCGNNSIDSPDIPLIEKEGRLFCSRCLHPIKVQKEEGVG